MTFYPPKISEKFHAPKNIGAATDANATGTNATFVCGAVLRFTLRIETDAKKILEARFKTSGCGYLIAAAETLAKEITGKNLTKLHKPDEQVLYSEFEVDQLPESRKHCFELAVEALQSAFADFRQAQIEEFTGEKALICTCFGVSEDTIEDAVKTNALETVEDVTDVCSAGGGCGSCQPLIQEIIDIVWREEI